MANIVWFREVSIKDIPLVGGKGASLGEMTRANFPIPPGFVVTAEAYFNFLKQAGIKRKVEVLADNIDVENTKQLETISAQIREIVKSAEMLEELQNEIKTAYRKLGEKKLAWLTSSEEEYVAVRSSATAEDLPEASFAGQQETYLNVMGRQQLLDAVKNCWASLFTARAIYYRKKQGFKTEKVGIAVVVQKMIDSKVAGVIFTADPTGDESKIVIEAAFGLGEAVVSGSLTPDTYVVDKGSFKILDKRVTEQEWAIMRKGRGSEKIEVHAKSRKKQKLSDKMIVDLAKIGKQIELHYKKPQDLEFAVEENKIYIVQSRPITTLGLKEKKEEKRAEGKVLLEGLRGSPGIAAGIVRIVPNVRDVSIVQPGDIIVTKMTSPDWVPTMKKAKAIITDKGGRTCHAAIVSRELGVPCVVGTEKATDVLKSGQTVTVDGYNGKVFEGNVEVAAPKQEEKKEIVEKEEFDIIEEALEKGAEEAKEKEEPLKEIPEIASESLSKEEFAARAEEEREEIAEKASAAIEEIAEEFGETPAAAMKEEEVKEEQEKLVGILEKVAVKVKVNVALTDAAEQAAATNAYGVGLLRAEHMITSSGKHPAEFIRQGKQEELKQVIKDGIKKVAEKFKDKPVWYRTFDARSDEFRELEGGDKEPHEDNPMLGWHGIRRDLDEPKLLKTEFSAIKELRDEGFDNVGVMLAFVQSVEELKKAKEIAMEAGLEPDSKDLQFGIMVETPAASWDIEEFIKEGIDFVSFGTNDLTQLTLGVDRNNERIQKWFNELHPAVLKQLHYVIKHCRRAGVKTSICGQAASNPEMVKKLVRFGIDSVSANIDAVEKIKEVVLVEEKNLILEKKDE